MSNSSFKLKNGLTLVQNPGVQIRFFFQISNLVEARWRPPLRPNGSPWSYFIPSVFDRPNPKLCVFIPKKMKFWIRSWFCQFEKFLLSNCTLSFTDKKCLSKFIFFWIIILNLDNNFNNFK